MLRCSSRALEIAVACSTLWLAGVRAVNAQACCAGVSALTPGRLVMHEKALVGAQVRNSLVLGSFGGSGAYTTVPARSSDVELEQDLFGAVRLSQRAQLALLVPFLEARRADRSGAEFGGGIGDVALNGRYEFTLAGRAGEIPGIALLVGATLPTGKAPEKAARLGTDATGIGAVQASAGLSLEQTLGRWLVSLTGLASLRATRTIRGVGSTALAPQWSALAGVAYAFEQGGSMSISAQYATEGNATIAGMSQPMSGRRRTLLTLAGLWSLTDTWDLRGYVMWDPAISQLGRNQLSNTGLGVTLVHAWL